jgi:hypothetical protein
MSGKCGEISILQRRLERPCDCIRRLIGDDANMDPVASVYRVADQMLLAKRRKQIA